MVGRYKNSLLLRTMLALIPLLAITSILSSGQTSADVLKSSHYQLQPTVGDSFGGSVGSSNYKLTDSGGEAVIGNGAGGSYKIGAGFVAELQHSINLYVEPSGLAAYYPMNEGAGPTVHDASANSNDGTATGTTWVDGKIGKALQFNGSTSYMSAQSNISVTSGTVSMWVNSSSSQASSVGYIFSYPDAADSSRIYINTTSSSGNVIQAKMGNGTVIGAPTITTNVWHYLTLTWSGTTASFYLDGQSVTSTGSFNGLSSSFPTINLGCLNNTLAQCFTGDIDDVKIFNRALNADEVEANYEAGLAGLDSGLVIPAIKAGNSQTVGADVIISADAPYSLLTNETSLLTLVNGSATIPSIGGTIASPAAWQDGTTQGLGFTVLNGPSASPPPGKWGSGADYAAVPADATSFYNRSGFTGGAKDTIQLQYRLDVSGAQAAGQYKNDVVYTATETP